jgi:glycosyltransferase involved in cell wall biosynthesis
MKPVRTLLLHRDLLHHGGIPRVFLNFLRRCDQRRVEPQVASFAGATAPMLGALNELQVPVHELGDHGYFQPALRLRKILASQAIAVVLACSLKSYLVAKLAAAGTQCRVVFWIHGMPHLIMAGRLKKAIYRLAARRDTLVYITDAVRRAHSFSQHTGREKVIYSGIEDPVSRPADQPYDKTYRQELGIDVDATVLGFTGEFVPWKRHDLLLEAFAQLAPRYPKLHLVLIGTGALYDQTLAAAQALPGHERIHFLSQRADARRLLGIMDIYVQPSDSEGLSIAVAEAMLAGLPVLVSEAVAVPELITRGKSGLVFRLGDVRDLINQLETLLQDARLRSGLGMNARNECLRRFSPERFANELASLVEQEAGVLVEAPVP